MKTKHRLLLNWSLPTLSLLLFHPFNATAAIAQSPLFLSANIPPIVLLTLGRDHKLYYEAYNDASDLDGDGEVDVRYKPSIDYYGYFDSHKCYQYASNKFSPINDSLTKTCSSAWSGDYLNYLTTSRIDALRKVLYGGYRSTDTATTSSGSGSTVLKRAYIPQDAHSWGKEYTSEAVDGYKISDYTPLPQPSVGMRHFFANTTITDANSDPLLRVLENNANRIWGWLSKERPVAGNSITRADGGDDWVTPTDYKLYVDVCVDKPGVTREANCKSYTSGNNTTYKPTGLLQIYGENDAVAFGLLSGSYAKNISGGVLRKNISSFGDEIDSGSGVFTNTNGIVSTLNKLRIESFSHANAYTYASGWTTDRPINEGEAAEWGNPVAEMMFEALRYFSGETAPSSAFSIPSTGTPDDTLGLPLPNWLDPYRTTSGGYLSCSKPIQMVISDINPSFDTDQLPGSFFNSSYASSGTRPVNTLNVSTLADSIWGAESESNTIFIGQSGLTNNDGAPTAKPANSFSSIRGLTPEEPTKQGGYYSASVALFGARNDLNAAGDSSSVENKKNQKTDTIAVALASPLPRFEIPINGKTVTLVPYAKSVAGAGISPTADFQPTNQIVDFYVEKIANTVSGNMDSGINNGKPYGKFRINYEDVEQAADHDMDAIVEYTFAVNNANQLVVSLNSSYAAGGIIQHMGYVISGTTTDGLYLEVRDLDTAAASDPDFRLDTPPGQLPGGSWEDHTPLPISTTRIFNVGNTSASFIKHDPLWYAAKWGVSNLGDNGVLDTSEWDADNDGIPDNYFLVTNAGKLPEQLGKAFAKLLDHSGSASAAATNSSQLNSGALIYQAKFDPKDWSGQLLALSLDPNTKNLNTTTPVWDAAKKLPAPVDRNIVTFNPDAAAAPRGLLFKDTTITNTQMAYLNILAGTTDSRGADRVNWLRGDSTNEKRFAGSNDTTHIFRNRLKKLSDNTFLTVSELTNTAIQTNKLGDIVNSAPVYVGTEDYGYSELANSTEAAAYSTFKTTTASRTPMIYTGANDGMLHGFNALSSGGNEVFAYVPNALFPELSKLTSPGYSHQYFVDGTAAAGDVYFGPKFHTLLAGTTGAGGKAVFALDVTNPSALGTASPLWEFTSADALHGADLGYTLGQPVIGKLNNGSWAVIFANGYNSSTGKAVLFIRDAQTGAEIATIDTGATGANGLSSPVAFDADNNHTIDYLYAGDLKGNLWKFDVRNSSSTSWTVTKLFTACSTIGTPCSAANLQPITSKPGIGKVTPAQSTGIMVYFGTGKYYETGDNVIGASPQVQSYYGLWDNNTGTITDRAQLQAQSITYEGIPTNTDGSAAAPDARLIRISSRNTVCYATDILPSSDDDTPNADCTQSSNLKKGWVMDLLKPTNIAQGERVISQPVFYKNLLLFSTVIPNSDPCLGGGTSWLMLIDAATGKRSATPTFDRNGDGAVNDDDLVKDEHGNIVGSSGLNFGVGVHSEVTKTGSVVSTCGDTGDCGTATLFTDTAGKGRISWRQLR